LPRLQQAFFGHLDHQNRDAVFIRSLGVQIENIA
jgi:hypothetical protein